MTTITNPIPPPALFVCPTCATYSQGAPHHGWGKPCPHTLRVMEATIANLDAQRMSAIRSATAGEDAIETMRRMFGGGDE